MKRRIRSALPVLFFSILSSCPSLAATIHVPADQPTIQAGIDAAAEGDLVLAAPGTYEENLNFLGKSITVQSEAGAKATLIDGSGAGPVVTFENSESEDTVLDGFTLTNGHYLYGGGIWCAGASPRIMNCMISGNSGSSAGGGICCRFESYPAFTNCTISENNALVGGGIYCTSSLPTILFCTISENSADSYGGAIDCYSSLTITNCILWGNSAPSGPGIYVHVGSPVVTYSDIQGGWTGEGNIDSDPLFGGEGDYHLTLSSPCIDSGIDAGVYADLDGDVRPQGAGFDMGADEYPDCWDADMDGYGDPTCGGYDCDDSDPVVYPGADEICDSGIDEDCDGLVDWMDTDCCDDDDGDGYIDADCGGSDCDDSDVDTYPGADEFCDGKDNDCDGTIGDDEADADGDGWMICEGDCDDIAPEVHPGLLESAGAGNCDDGQDNDCDGLVDTDPECYNMIRIPADYSTIQAGIDAAMEGGLVIVSPGTYPENIDFLGKAITVRSEEGAEVTIIDGNQDWSVVTFLNGESEWSRLDGFTIRNGHARYGGGLFCLNSSPTIENCTISGNSAYIDQVSAQGGGIYCEKSSPTIVGCTILENIATSGGGVYCDSSSSPTIANCTIMENIAATYGGGIGCSYSSDPWVVNCVISDNRSSNYGGAIFCSSSSPTITNCSLFGNRSDLGGGINISWNSSPMITHCSFADNSAGSGGAVYCKDSASPTLINCSITGNMAVEEGGGIYSENYSFTMDNCIISYNSAPLGGGLYCYYYYSEGRKMQNCIFYGNHADQGGGIYCYKTNLTITNCVLWMDHAPQGPEIWIDPTDYSSIVTVSYCDVQGGEPAVYVDPGSSLLWLEGNMDSDPLFADEDGFHLTVASPCIDAGDPDSSFNDACFPPSLGTERNDMGAYGGPGACGWCGDHDGDGHTSSDCAGTDCDDVDPDIYSGAPELCDGKDSDCDGIVPDDEADDDLDGWRICEGDCNDGNFEVNPGRPEIPGNGIDDDCDGLIDEPTNAIHVPAEQATIQAGIDAALPGDFVLVGPGTYEENLSFLGKDITVRSEAGAESTIIDGNRAGPVLTFDGCGTEWAAIEGFTIQNGRSDNGGGIYCVSSSLRINNCVIKDNHAYNASGALTKGGGICCLNSPPTIITNCTIIENMADWDGGGIYCGDSSSIAITNCTIAENRAVTGGAIYCDYSDPTITDCIVWDNFAMNGPAIYTSSSSLPWVNYCDIQGGWFGEGNLDMDPLFVGGGDYHLTFNSPCIDTGTDVGIRTDRDGEGRPRGTGFDMGSDEYPECWDSDGDGYGDADCGGYDCDDTVHSMNPGVKERCTGGTDEDCDGLVDSDDPDCVTIRVPAHKPTIQAAINTADDGNLILVAPGIYKERINFLGKNISLQSALGADVTVIDGKRAGSVVTFSEGETEEAVIDGFTIRNGLGSYGGGIFCNASSPTITNCSITGNELGFGIYCQRLCSSAIMNCTISDNFFGGIQSSYSSMHIDNCIVRGNHDTGIDFSDSSSITISNCVIKENHGSYGGGISCDHSSPTIINCTITGNIVEYKGGGLYCLDQDSDSTSTIMNCTISGNIAGSGGGIYCDEFSPVMKNCIVWGNSARNSPEIADYYSSSPDITYSNVMGGWEGEGNINENPLFVGLGDYHLAHGSPCIDSGTDTGVCTDVEGDIRPHGQGFDMGSDEFTWGFAKLPLFVPLRFPTIQACIDAAWPGDVCLVLPGVYQETIDFKGKAVRVEGLLGPDSTVIEGNLLGPVVDFSTYEAASSVIDGFTIRKGAIYGGIRCYDSSPTIMNCTITENSAEAGGGIYCIEWSSPKITGCTIENNIALAGGGVYFDDIDSISITSCTIRDNIAFWGGGVFYINLYVCSSLEIANCVIAGNHAVLGGGVYGIGYSTTITNCTIAENSATMKGGGFRCYYSYPEVTNSILWGNTSPIGPEIALTNKSRLHISYSNVQGGEWRAYVSPSSELKWLEGNINIIPLFVGGGDYHLLPLSPCIDAGTDACIYTDMDGQARPFGSSFDIGADEYRPVGCQVLIVPTSHAPIALLLFPALVLIFLGRKFSVKEVKP